MKLIYKAICMLSVILFTSYFMSCNGDIKITIPVPSVDGTFKMAIGCCHAFCPVSVDYDANTVPSNIAAQIVNQIQRCGHFTVSQSGANVIIKNECIEGDCVASIVYQPIRSIVKTKFQWDPNTLQISDNYLSATFSLEDSASGLSWDGFNPGKVSFGTSFYVANVNTFPGQTPRQILDEAKSQLIANGFQDVSVNTQNNIVYNITFKLDAVRDSVVEFTFDDSGVKPSAKSYASCSECDSCIILGPEHIPIYTTGNTYNEDSLKGGWWNLYNYSANASIEWQNDSMISVSAGNTGGFFKICYKVLVLPDSVYYICCKFIYVDDPTPIEMINFNSVTSGANVTLNWSTSNEINNSGFKIIRSTADQTWTEVGFVNGSGNSTEPKNYSFIDRNLNSGIYNYRLKQIDFNGNYEFFDLSEEVVIGVPDKFSLHQNYPNPFNPFTKIRYDLPVSGNTSLKIYDNTGREIKTLVSGFKEAGYYTAEFNGSGFASGVYYYKIESGNFIATKKMVLLK